MIRFTGERGCGYEAPLEAMYRFLVDPEPPLSVKLENQVSTPTSINEVLLAQRKSFLRPDSAVAIVMLSDENDCSIIDTGLGWFTAAETRLPLATAACALNPNDSCCRSCATYEPSPPKGCSALTADSVCKTTTPGQPFAALDQEHDSLNLAATSRSSASASTCYVPSSATLTRSATRVYGTVRESSSTTRCSLRATAKAHAPQVCSACR